MTGILEQALLDVIEGRQTEFEAAFAQAQSIISALPGYRWHRLERCLEQPNRYLLLVEWDSLAAHVDGFRNSPQYQRWKALLHHFYDPFPTVEHYEPVIRVDRGDSPDLR